MAQQQRIRLPMQETRVNTGLIPGSGRSPGGGNGNLLQYPSLENLIDPGAWRATVHRIPKSQAKQHYFSKSFQRPSRDITLWLRKLDCPPSTHRVKCNPSTWPSRMFTTSIIVLPHLYSYCSRNIPWSDQDISCLLGKSCPFAPCGPPQGSLGKQFCDSYPIPSLNSNSTYSILCSLTGNRALS